MTERELRHEGEYLELVLPSVDNISSKCYGRTRACLALEPLLQINAEHPLYVCLLDMGIWTSLSVSWDTGSPPSNIDAPEMRSAVGTGVIIQEIVLSQQTDFFGG